MPFRLLALFVVLATFGALSTAALLDVGYLGLITPAFQNWGPAQVLADLVILSVLGCLWMVGDARTRGAAAWPYVVLTLVTGSFGVLIYLVVREVTASRVAARPVHAGNAAPVG